MIPTAVVTGIGVIAPTGAGTETYWEATLAGRCGISVIDRFDSTRYRSRLAGQITEFDATEHLPPRLLPQTDRVTRLALVAADWAIADADIDIEHETGLSAGVVTSNATGGFEFTHKEINKLWNRGPQHVSVYESFAWFYAVNTGQISIRNGMRGPGAVLVAEQAGGLDAIGHARRGLRRGASMMITGGVESSLDPWGWASHIASGALSERTSAESAYLPFDMGANGYVPGEGGAILVLESEEDARVRGAKSVHGRIAGYAATFDAAPTAGGPDGLARAVRAAIADADLTPADIDVVFADAAGTRRADEAEATAISDVFGPHGVIVTAPKSGLGRLYSGGPPLDVATALLSIRDSVVPPTSGVQDVPDSYHLDLVTEKPRERDIHTAAVLARGRGGFNAVVVVTI